MADRFEELRTYVAIVEAGGVNAAAANLGIARSAVSKRLSDLEARLGVILIARSKRSFEPTGKGRSLHADAKRILHDLGAVEARLAEQETSDGEVVAVAADADVATHLLAAPVAAFLAERPGARVSFVEQGTDDADVVVAAGELPGGRPLTPGGRIVVAAPSYLERRGEPASPADLSTHLGIAVAANGEADWRFDTGAVTRPTIVVDVPRVDAALALAIAGAGLAQLPRHACQEAIGRGDLKVAMPRHETRGAEISVARGDTANVSADALLRHLVATIGARGVRRR